MRKVEIEAEYKRIAKMAADAALVAENLQKLATRLENEANLRLEDLGRSDSRRRKAPKTTLDPELRLNLMARMQGGKGSRGTSAA
ncbi:hypothetical protein ACLI1A_10355 [Flavobacterium sp. RHBU_3]|uniref:hypothetical protein n=1 Tax=Flavobacterium sp. RHBU_3 TaxID=3391184 RepID=UPI003984C9CA